ncbi:hypothetical protein C8R47DRAFT_1169124 [Mycena vitilis]|nr:hypothetical protein C8R47DRAFT_1169124 [Mycena vitilis]
MDSEQQEGGDTVQILLHHFQHAEDAQPVQVVEAAGSPTEKAVLSTYRTHMKAFRGSGKPPRLCELKPVLDRRRDLRMYLEVDPQLSSYARRALDISARSIQMPRGQYLFFIPTHVWDAGLSAWTTAPREDADPTTSWADALTMGDKQEETKEVFATHGAHRLYVGTFRCHDLSALFPEGVGVPKSISSRAVRDAALSARPPSSNNYDSETLIQRRWPDGMKVHATALEFVGFDSALYDSLRARFVAEEGPIAMFPDEDGTEEGIEKWIEAAEGSKVGNEVEVEKLKEEGQKGEKKEEDEREQEQEHDKEQEQGSTGDEDEAYSGWGLRASRWAV